MSFVCHSQSSSLFLKSPNFLRVQSRHLFGFRKKDPKSSRHVTRLQQDPSGADGVSKSSKNYIVRRQFIPMTRRALVKRIIHEENVVTSADKGHYHNFAVALDAYVGKKFNSVLGDFKSLFDPFNPDKETVVTKHRTKEELKKEEKILLQGLAKCLDQGGFYEMPKSAIEEAFQEHEVTDGVRVSVDSGKYDILRIWVIGKDLEPVEKGAFYRRLFTGMRDVVISGSQKKPMERYKRVVVALRHKKEQKLILKAFKDIPCANLEYLIPDGEIKMSTFDQGVLVTTVTIGVTSLIVKLVTFLADYHVDWIFIATAITGVVAIRAWTVYKNKRNIYLGDLCRTLYFKSVANNRALLTLVTDRAADEVFKRMLMTYAFLNSSSRSYVSGDSPGDEEYLDGMTFLELKGQVDGWMSNKFGATIEFDPTEPVHLLRELGILYSSISEGEEEILRVIPIQDAIRKLPAASLSEHKEKESGEEEI